MEENMYKSKSDRNPYKPLLKSGLLGIGLIVFGIYEYFDIAAMEAKGIVRLGRKFRLFYDLMGKTGIVIFFCGIGLLLLGVGIYETRKLIKDKANQNLKL